MLMSDFGFKSIGSTQLTSPFTRENIPFRHINNFSYAPNLKIFAAAGPLDLVVGCLETLKKKLENNKENDDFTKVPLKNVNNVSFTKDEKYLLVTSDDKLLYISTDKIKSGRFESIDLDFNVDILSVNPANGQEVLILNSKRQLILFDISKVEQSQLSQIWIIENVVNFDWSKDGEEILVGSKDGQIKLFSSRRDELLSIDQYDDLKELNVLPLSVIYLAKNKFYAVFGKEQEPIEDEEPFYDFQCFIIDYDANSKSVSFSESFDITPTDGSFFRKQTSYISYLHHLSGSLPHLTILASSTSAEISALSNEEVLISNDNQRASLPIDSVTSDVINPIGLIYDIDIGEEVDEPCPGVSRAGWLPTLWSLGHDGKVEAWYIFHIHDIKNKSFSKQSAKAYENSLFKLAQNSPKKTLPSITNSFKGQHEPNKSNSVPEVALPQNSTDSKPELSAFGNSSFGSVAFSSSSTAAPFGKSDTASSFGKPAFGTPKFGTPAFGSTSFTSQKKKESTAEKSVIGVSQHVFGSGSAFGSNLLSSGSPLSNLKTDTDIFADSKKDLGDERTGNNTNSPFNSGSTSTGKIFGSQVSNTQFAEISGSTKTTESPFASFGTQTTNDIFKSPFESVKSTEKSESNTVEAASALNPQFDSKDKSKSNTSSSTFQPTQQNSFASDDKHTHDLRKETGSDKDAQKYTNESTNRQVGVASTSAFLTTPPSLPGLGSTSIFTSKVNEVGQSFGSTNFGSESYGFTHPGSRKNPVNVDTSRSVTDSSKDFKSGFNSNTNKKITDNSNSDVKNISKNGDGENTKDFQKPEENQGKPDDSSVETEAEQSSFVGFDDTTIEATQNDLQFDNSQAEITQNFAIPQGESSSEDDDLEDLSNSEESSVLEVDGKELEVKEESSKDAENKLHTREERFQRKQLNKTAERINEEFNVENIIEPAAGDQDLALDIEKALVISDEKPESSTSLKSSEDELYEEARRADKVKYTNKAVQSYIQTKDQSVTAKPDQSNIEIQTESTEYKHTGIQSFENDEILQGSFSLAKTINPYINLKEVKYPSKLSSNPVMKSIELIVYDIEAEIAVVEENSQNIRKFIEDHMNPSVEHTEVSIGFSNQWRLSESAALVTILRSKAEQSNKLLKDAHFDIGNVKSLQKSIIQLQNVFKSIKGKTIAIEMMHDPIILNSRDLSYDSILQQEKVRKAYNSVLNKMREIESKLLTLKTLTNVYYGDSAPSASDFQYILTQVQELEAKKHENFERLTADLRNLTLNKNEQLGNVNSEKSKTFAQAQWDSRSLTQMKIDDLNKKMNFQRSVNSRLRSRDASDATRNI
ncbi:hypothetical protein WICMUC_001147 [Wickerhamomyces mucosus]|uniref:Nucleoporin Nup159/Nup146 N-terminal domain-containing protein n=1 Tax=Wickerhamomyces mucosus TaxID=1378264 RepID=A0A9P8PX02_9ASCO|nr:hypothetical protein WICMUC_001147 [Wickerhamomyces mucosus]